jgi:NADH-quinone oxidoreductase subunit I
VLKLVREMGYGLWSIGKGMGVTLKNLLLFRTRKQTVMYPYEELVVPPTYRGALRFIEERCIVCELCEKACPVPGSQTEKTIEMFWHIGDSKKRALDEFYIDYSTCINCYLCVDACPTDALLPGASYTLGKTDALAQYDRSRMVFGKVQLEEQPESADMGGFERAHEHVPGERPAGAPSRLE